MAPVPFRELPAAGLHEPEPGEERERARVAAGVAAPLEGEFRRFESPVITVQGRVLNAHARVSFSTSGADFAPVPASVNREGAFQVRLPRADTYVVQAAAEGFWDYRNSGFSVQMGNQAELDVLIPPRGSG